MLFAIFLAVPSSRAFVWLSNSQDNTEAKLAFKSMQIDLADSIQIRSAETMEQLLFRDRLMNEWRSTRVQNNFSTHRPGNEDTWLKGKQKKKKKRQVCNHCSSEHGMQDVFNTVCDSSLCGATITDWVSLSQRSSSLPHQPHILILYFPSQPFPCSCLLAYVLLRVADPWVRNDVTFWNTTAPILKTSTSCSRGIIWIDGYPVFLFFY